MLNGAPPSQGHDGRHLTRRGVLAGAVAALAAAFVVERNRGGAPPRTSGPARPVPSGPAVTEPSTTTTRPVFVNQPGPPEVIFGGEPSSGAFALTIDDGTCAHCAAEIVAAVQQTGFPVTLSPNGYMGPSVWDSQAEAIAAMAATGQLSVCNHTWDHKALTKLTAAQVQDELLRNEAWIQDHFGVSSRPFYRPPYGFHNDRVDELAGELGWTKVIMWNATLGDSIVHPPEFILQQLDAALVAGTIMLGHANHPATASVINQIVDMVQQSGLRPVTLLELLGTDPNPDLAGIDRVSHRTVPGPATGSAPTTTAPTTTAPTTTAPTTPMPPDRPAH